MEKEQKRSGGVSDLEKRLRQATKQLEKKSRELEIEAALEKVRSRAISMRSSTELSETSVVLFEQLKVLNIRAIRTGVGIFDDEHEAMELWVTSVSNNQEVLGILDYFSLHIHPVFENIIPARKQQKAYSLTVLSGREVRDYYQIMSTYLAQPSNQVYREKEFFYSFFFQQGTLNVVTDRILTDEECSIMIRFALAFGLIYARFLDLKGAEEQTIKAQRQTSIERVRAEIASMRTTDDLNRITPLVWQELTSLGVPFFRCGVYIVDDQEEQVHMYFSTPEGEPLTALHLPFDISEVVRNATNHWRANEVYTTQWNREQFAEWIQLLMNQRQIGAPEQYLGSLELPEFITLQFIPFTQGMLYVGSIEPLEDDHIDLVKSLADSFSVAYARYEDFKQLEDAKNRVEATLSELKTTQSQLIQAEKMASLGELTAGIAHEIQNPLNFVNNFAEVNSELIAEMKLELQSGNYEEAVSIADSIDANEKKILFHGKRADGIVKGMLQHSRSSSGVKEPTDINELADEYLRLAYHGLRAKDKSFTATMKTEFDQGLGKVQVVPQEIGRVILNLITNAFYAVTERRKGNESGYEPTVWVRTKRDGNNVVISVTDNGNGIPAPIADKIFQPFFTTKPTGQGTGLGLSMSYDIVTKSHNGLIKVESEEGKGTTFVVVLPFKSES